MRGIKLLGLAALAALATTMFLGAGSASATTLCTVNVGTNGECPIAKRIPNNATFEAHASHVTLRADEYQPSTCTSDMKFKVTGSYGNYLGMGVELQSGMNVQGCDGIIDVYCANKAVAKNQPSASKITETANGNGNLHMNETAGPYGLEFESCGFPYPKANCRYEASKGGLDLAFEGGIPAGFISLRNLVLKVVSKENGACFGSITMSGDYAIEGETFTASSSNAVLSKTNHEPLLTCNSNLSASLIGGSSLSSLTFASCVGALEGTNCASGVALKTPYKVAYSSTGPGEGSVVISSGGSGQPVFEYSKCSMFNLMCRYTAETLTLDLKGSNQLVASDEPLTRGTGSGDCSFQAYFPEKALWSGTFNMSGPVLAVTAKP